MDNNILISTRTFKILSTSIDTLFLVQPIIRKTLLSRPTNSVLATKDLFSILIPKNEKDILLHGIEDDQLLNK